MVSGIAAKAQEDRRPWMPLENRVGIAVGLGSHTFLDQNSSPLIYQSKPKNVRIFYQLESNNLLFTFDIDVKMGGLQSKYHSDRMLQFDEENYKGAQETKRFPVGGSFLAAKVAIGGFYKIKSTQESTFKVAAGVSISNEMFYPQGWTSTGVMNALTIAPKAITQHRISEHHKLTGSIGLPLLARVTRLPYHNSVSYPGETQLSGFFRNSKWTSLNHFIAPEFSLGYEYLMSNRWGTGLTYDLNWYNVNTENRFKAVSQFFRASVYHQF